MKPLWTTFEEQRLRGLKAQGWSTFDIAVTLGRTPKGIEGRWRRFQQADAASQIAWTTELNQALIDHKRRRLCLEDIAAALGVPADAVSAQWLHLQRKKSVPEEVLEVCRNMIGPPWTVAEDDVIKKLSKDGLDDAQIMEHGGIKKSRPLVEVTKRRKELMG